MSSRNSFAKGFEKISAPNWFYEMNRTLNKNPSLKGISGKGLKSTRVGKEVLK